MASGRNTQGRPSRPERADLKRPPLVYAAALTGVLNGGRLKIKSLALAGVIGIAIGCAGPRVSRNPGATKLVERIPDRRPDWVDWRESSKEEKDRLVFIGAVRDRADYSLAVREAGIEATKLATELLARELNTSLRSSIVGQNMGDDLGRAIQDLFIQESRSVSLTGLVQRERYAEKWAEGTVSGQRTVYLAWALMELPRADYLLAKQVLLDRAAGRARASRNAKAEEVLEKFRAEAKAEGAVR